MGVEASGEHVHKDGRTSCRVHNTVNLSSHIFTTDCNAGNIRETDTWDYNIGYDLVLR